MLETIDSYLVQQYLADLRRELIVSGLAANRVADVLSETRSHLEEAIEAAQPQSQAEVEELLVEFGQAKRMAKKLTAEYERARSARNYWWPVGFFLAAYAVFQLVHLDVTFFRPTIENHGQSGLQLFGLRVFSSSIWSGTVFGIASAVTLFVMGYRARKPVIGQFAISAVLLFLGGTAWYMATSYPLDTGAWLEPVRRSAYDSELLAMRGRMESERLTAQLVVQGKEAFSSSKTPQSVPSAFKYGSQFLMPEAIREVMLGVKPSQLSPSLLSSSWTVAQTRWNSPQEHRSPGQSEADEVLQFVPFNLKLQQSTMDKLKWVHDQPLSVQIPLDFRLAWIYTVPITLAAMLTTLAGWLLWLVVGAFSRLVRRATYRQKLLQTS